MKTNREIALKWWVSLSFEEQFYATIRQNKYIEGDHTRNPNSLTGCEIEIIWKHENNN